MAKIQSMLLLVLVEFFAFVSANKINDNWPCYLKKCERNALDFDSCLLNHANMGFKHIIKGDDEAAIPNFVPYALDFFRIGTNQTFKIYLNHGLIYGINYLDIYDIKWDLKKKNIFIEFHISNTLRISALYAITGQYEGKNITSDKGIMDFVYGEGALTYNMTYKTKVRNGMNYATIDKCKATRKNSYLRYRMHDPTTDGPKEDEFPDHAAIKLDKALDIDINGLICAIINIPFRALFYNFPVDMMFN